MRLIAVLPLLLLAACGGSGSDPLPPGSGGGDSLTDGGITRAENDLVVEHDAGDGSPPQTWTLTCVGVAEGDHPEAERACAHLDALEDPFVPLPADAICTEQYGGPQTARVTGLWRGEPVDLQLSRTNGCTISQWESLVPLVPSAAT